MSRPVIVIGAGGHAKVVIDALRRRGVEFAGLVDEDAARAGTRVMGLPVLGGDEVLAEYRPSAVALANGIGSIPLRRAAYDRFARRRFAFVGVTHPSAVVPPETVLGQGSQIMAGAVVQPGVRIGINAIINTRASVDHDCLIGDHAHVAPGATLSGGVRVGDGTLIGAGATVIESVCIGQDAVVGAGAVVVRDVADGATVVGVPARPMESAGRRA